MENLIEILPNIYGVKVPLDAEDFEQSRSQYNYNIRLINYSVTHPIYFYQGESVEIGDFNFKILGTITATEISFDASDIVECQSKTFSLYKNYKADTGYMEHMCRTPEQSFRSALPKEIYFQNPLGKEEPNETVLDDYDVENQYQKISQWQTAQQNITEKLLILQKL